MFERIDKEHYDMVYPILQEAFPVTELREKGRQKALLEEPYYHLYGITGADQQVEGVIAAWEIDDFLYIEHFAILPDFRNGGFGGKKLMEFVAMIDKPVVVEVEPGEDDLTRRRIGFYERHGFYCNDYPYLQPPMRAGQPLMPLMLMTSPSKISEDVYNKYKTLIHKLVYKYEEA